MPPRSMSVAQAFTSASGGDTSANRIAGMVGMCESVLSVEKHK